MPVLAVYTGLESVALDFREAGCCENPVLMGVALFSEGRELRDACVQGVFLVSGEGRDLKDSGFEVSAFVNWGLGGG